MATLKSINSKVWGISVLGTGLIAEGIASLRQCIFIILHTSLGSDPLRPLFGSKVYKYQDAPVNIAVPNIKASIIQALSIWEKRIRVLSVTHRYNDTAHLEFEITYLLVDENLIDSIIFSPGGITGGSTSNLVLQMIFPPGSDHLRNTVKFLYLNNTAQPQQPADGFTNTTETFNWCSTNWAHYGRWELLADRILLYLPPGSYPDTTLNMYVYDQVLKFQSFIPPITTPGTSYRVLFNPNDTGLLQSDVIQPTPPLLTKEAILLFARNNWGSYGRWELEYVVNTNGSFSNDFGSDFDSLYDGYVLALYSNIVTAAQLDTEII